jgi:hypothetical protein
VTKPCSIEMAISIRAFYRTGHFVVDFFAWLSKTSSPRHGHFDDVRSNEMTMEMAVSMVDKTGRPTEMTISIEGLYRNGHINSTRRIKMAILTLVSSLVGGSCHA